MMSMWRLAFQYMMVRRVRTILAILAIVFGIAILFASNNFISAVVDEITLAANLPTRSDLRLVRVDEAEFQADNIVNTLRTLNGVVSVSGIFQRSFNMNITGDETSPPVITLLGVDPIHAQRVSQYPLIEGRFFAADDTNVVIIPASVARLVNFNLDDHFPLFTPSGLRLYTIVGILDDSQLPITQMIVPLTDTQTIFRAPDQITALDIAIDGDTETISKQILEAVGAAYRIDEAPSTDFSLVVLSFNFFGMMALFLSAFLIYNTYQVAVIERQQDLAILRTIGANRRQITQVILFESLIQGLIGSGLGLLIGGVLSIWLVRWVEASGWTTGAGNLQTQLSPLIALLCAGLGVGTALVAGYLPACAASRVSPLAALRPLTHHHATISRWRIWIGILGLMLAIVLILYSEETIILGGLILLLTTMIVMQPLVAPLSAIIRPLLGLLFPTVNDLAQGNIVRQPNRAAVIVNAILVGFAVFVASAAIVINLSGFFREVYQENFLSDILIFPLGGETVVFTGTALGVDTTLADDLRGVAGVLAVSSLRSTNMLYAGQSVHLLGVDPQYAGELRPFRVYEAANDARTRLQTERAIYLNATLAQSAALGMDELILLDTPRNGLHEYRIVAIGDDIDLQPNLPGALIANRWIEEDFGVVNDVTLYLELADTADTQQVLAEVQNRLRDYPQMFPIELRQFRETATQRGELISSFFYIMAILVIIPALFGVLNTVIMNVLERKREIGMLRAIGGNQAHVQRAFIVEMLYLSSIGILLGSIVGIMLGMGLVQIWDSALTVRSALDGNIPVLEILLGMVIGTILVLMVTFLPACHSSRENIVQVLRYE
jgi:putative ABC transport system permease protein